MGLTDKAAKAEEEKLAKEKHVAEQRLGTSSHQADEDDSTDAEPKKAKRKLGIRGLRGFI